MNEKRNNNQPPQGMGLGLDDIYFVLFRHKWAIIICALVGVGAACFLLFGEPPVYSSDAQLYVKYVSDETTPNPADLSEKLRASTGDSIINSELIILKSADLARQVATKVGPERILAMYGGGKDLSRATQVISDNFSVGVFPRTVAIDLIYRHRDPALVKEVLGDLITEYMKKHRDVHNPLTGTEFVDTETSSLIQQVEEANSRLIQARKATGVADPDQALRLDFDKLGKDKENLAAGLQALEIQKKRVEQIKAQQAAIGKTNDAADTTNVIVPPEIVTQYQNLKNKISKLEEKLQNLLVEYKEGNPEVVGYRDTILEAKERRKKLEAKYPTLAKVAKAETTDKEVNLNDEIEKLQGVEGGIAYLRGDIVDITNQIGKIDEYDQKIDQLRMTKEIAESALIAFKKRAQANQFEAEFSPGKSINISGVQEPSDPYREVAKAGKIVGIVLASGFIVGLAYAFLVELYLDRSVKRAKEIEGGMGLRLFLSIPNLNRNGRSRKAKAALLDVSPDGDAKVNGDGDPKTGPLVPATNGSGNGHGNLDIAPWDPGHALYDYSEALRDRLISYFERNNIVHKPKLVAVSGSSPGCGTTTIAAGLAASLSETGAGKVLLVDMNIEQGATQQFQDGRPEGLNTVLEGDNKHTALVQNNLYRVPGRADGDRISAMLPARFANLVPKLRASEYDYIIFDMPPVGRTGVTQRLAGFMDMMLLVVEAEKTNRDVVRQASGLLSESKANVSVVLNKTRNYIPKRLHQEF